MYARTARHWPPSRDTGREPTRRAASPTDRKTSKANRWLVPRALLISQGQPSPTWHFLGQVIEHRRRVGVLRPAPVHGRTGRFVGGTQDNGRSKRRRSDGRGSARYRHGEPLANGVNNRRPSRRTASFLQSAARPHHRSRVPEPRRPSAAWSPMPFNRSRALLPCRGTGRFPLAHLTHSRSGPPLCGGVVEPIGPALPPALRFDHPRIT